VIGGQLDATAPNATIVEPSGCEVRIEVKYSVVDAKKIGYRAF
jgi:hypothetical protein